MGFLILAAALVALVLVAIGLFSRTPTHETWRPTAGFPFALTGPQIHELARSVLTARNLRVESEEGQDEGGSWLIAGDATPVLGGRLYARTLAGPAPVSSAEVQSAVEFARAEGFHKVLLIAPHGFSDEARSAADETLVELVDGPRLLDLSRGAVDMAALRQGRVVPRAEVTLRAQQMLAMELQQPVH